MKTRLMVFIIIAMISGISTLAWCQPELVYSENGTIKKIDGIENSKPYYIENGDKKLFTEGGACALRVNDGDILSFGYVPIDYIVKHNSGGALNAVVAIENEARGDSWNRIKIDSFLKVWDEASIKNAYIFLCWYDPKSDLLPVNELASFHSFNDQINQMTLSTELKSEKQGGFPILFLWKDNRVVPPTSLWGGNPEIFKSIISGNQKSFENAATPDQINKIEDIFGNRAIHYAAAFGRVEIMKKLLAEGAEAKDKNSNKMTPLLIAAATGHTDIVDLLMQHDSSLLKQRDVDGKRAIHFASYCGHEAIVKELLRHEKRVDFEDSFSRMPVDYAINEKMDSIVGLLASSGAKIRTDAENQQLVLMDNISKDKYNTVSFLLAQKASANRDMYGTTPLIVAAGNSSLDVVTRLIDSGAKVNKTGSKEMTPLMMACLTGRPEVVKYLLEKGAEVNKKAESGLSAIEVAVLRNDPAMIDLLISHGVDIETKDKTGKSPFWLAAMLGYRESVKKLLDVGAKCDLNHDKAIELMEPAFRYDMPEAVNLALNQCLNADFLFYGKYPSTWVAEYYSADEILKLLLDHGAKKDGGAGLGIVEATELSEKPKIVEATPIYYPIELKRKYGSRKFKAKVLIDDEGKVLFPKMIDSEVHELDKIVMETITKWRFTAPKNVSGKACAVIAQIPILLECEDIEKRTWELAETDEPPKVIKAAALVYPVELKSKGIRGRVVLALILDENGIPEDIEVVSLTHKGFADAAIAAAKKFKFSPAYYQGKPVKVKVKLPIEFSF